MANQTDAQNSILAAQIKNEITEGANTATRVGTMFENLNDSKQHKAATGLNFVPANGLDLSNTAGSYYNQYTQSGALQINIVNQIAGGNAMLKVVKDGSAITLFVGATNITVIGKDPNSSDFDLTVGNVDRIIVWMDVATTDNPTGVYYTVTNLL